MLPPLPQVLAALADGIDVRGVYYWTLMDNIEWHEGFNMTFGLYAWCPIQGRSAGELRLREGSRELGRLYAAWPDGLQQLREYARQRRGAGGEGGAGGREGADACAAVDEDGDASRASEEAGVGLLDGQGRVV
jgi:hypothetical protein